MTAAAREDGRDGGLAALVLRRTVELAGIPAPTGAEGNRASVVRRWWEDDGWATSIDEAGNVWGQAGNVRGQAGIAAVALGVTRGEGEHTPAEWIETAPVAAGLAVLADTIRHFREEQG